MLQQINQGIVRKLTIKYPINDQGTTMLVNLGEFTDGHL